MVWSYEQRASWLAPEPDFLVVGLCAAWCGTCREFADTFAALAKRHPERTFVWLDIEDDSAIAGDIDVENFPSLAVFRHKSLVFFGVSEPQEGVVARLLDALKDAPATTAPDPVLDLYPALTKIA